MTLRPTVLALALIVKLGSTATARAQTDAAAPREDDASGGQAPLTSHVTIDVDATATGAVLEPVWAFYGYDEVNYTTTPEGEALLRALSAAHAAPVHVRQHFLFNTGDGSPMLKWGSTNLYTEDAQGNPVYDYTLIDSILDSTVESGTFPLFEIGFMPEALSSRPLPYQNSSPYALDGGSFYPPRDYEKWAALVTAWATHAKQRYPGTDSSWQWELWNEPDIGYWKGTFDEYAQLYDYTEAALHAVLPDASLGGPAVAKPDNGFLQDFLEHCANGTNAVSGQAGTRLDMVSFHAKGGVTLTEGHVQLDLGNQLRLHRTGFEIVAASEAFAATPIVISEADPDGCAACPVLTAPQNAYRNSPAYGAYEVAMMKRSLDLASEEGVRLRGVLTWAFTFPGSPYFAGYRALSTHGIHLPVLNAFKLLGELRGNRLSVASSGALPLHEILENGVRNRPDVDALAASENDEIRILVWNYHDDLVAAEPAHVTLDVALPPAFRGRAVVTHRRVDEAHGDAFTVWESQGSPAEPTPEQVAELRDATQAVALEPAREVEPENGVASLSFDLPRFGISLITLVPSSEQGHGTSTGSPATCGCRVNSQAGTSRAALLAALLGVALTRRQRHSDTRAAQLQVRRTVCRRGPFDARQWSVSRRRRHDGAAQWCFDDGQGVT